MSITSITSSHSKGSSSCMFSRLPKRPRCPTECKKQEEKKKGPCPNDDYLDLFTLPTTDGAAYIRTMRLGAWANEEWFVPCHRTCRRQVHAGYRRTKSPAEFAWPLQWPRLVLQCECGTPARLDPDIISIMSFCFASSSRYQGCSCDCANISGPSAGLAGSVTPARFRPLAEA